MTKFILATFFCLTVFAAQGSIISTLLEHTTLKGNGRVNMTEGLDLGYNASLSFKNEHVSIEIANLVTKFRAAHPNDTLDVKYDGLIALTQNGYEANATVDGVANYATKTNTSKCNITNYTETVTVGKIKNKNNWTIQAGQASAAGAYNGSVKSALVVDRRDDRIYLQQHLQGMGQVAGKAKLGDSDAGEFAHVHGGILNLDETIDVNPSGRVDSAHVHVRGHSSAGKDKNPNSTFLGNVEFLQFEGLKFNNTTSGVIRNGGGNFAGESYFNASRDANSSSARVVNAQKGLFIYKNSVFKNRTRIGDTFIRGSGGYAQAVNSQFFKNGTLDYAAANYGNGDEQWVAFPAKRDEKSVIPAEMRQFASDEVQEGASYEDHQNNPHGIIGGQWKSGVHYRVDLGDDAKNHGVDLETGFYYKANGADTINKQPWNSEGNHTSDTHWNVTADGKQLSNITTQTGHSGSFLKKVDEYNDELKGFLSGN